MNRLKRLRGYSRFNVVNVTVYLVVGAAIYFGWKYIPVYWDRESLGDIAANSILQGYRFGDDRIVQNIIDRAYTELGMKLTYENIKVSRAENDFFVDIYYDVTIEHPFDKKVVHHMHLNVKRSLMQ